MKRLLTIAAVLVLQGLGLAAPAAVDLENAAEKMGWHLGVQLYIFNGRTGKEGTFLRSLERAKDLGIHYAELSSAGPKFSNNPGQEFEVGPEMTTEQRTLVRKALAEAGIKAISYGVCGGNWPHLFDFANEMGLEFLNTEPPNDEATARTLARLAKDTGIKIAIHNHPKPGSWQPPERSRYWNPQVLLDFLKKANGSTMIGSCLDSGHFERSGMNPVQCVRVLKGHIFFYHLKDLNVTLAQAGGFEVASRNGNLMHDVPWGTGAGNIWGIMDLMNRWKWQGCLLAEYESWTPTQQEELRQSFEFLNMVAAAMDKDDWEPLFKNGPSSDQKKATTVGAWTCENGVISTDGKGQGDLYTKDQYGDFILDLEFKNVDDTNSGVFVRAADTKDRLNPGIEVQILQQAEPNPKHNTGAIYDVKGVEKNDVRNVGQWNHMTIIARKNMIYVMLNGNQVNTINLDQWTEVGKNPDGSVNKFKKTAYKDMARRGFIGLQNHGKAVAFQNVKIKVLE
jgi:sugar phosphate isomerase/epimerase